MMPLLLGGSVGKIARRSLYDLIVSYGGSGGAGGKARHPLGGDVVGRSGQPACRVSHNHIL